jgi:hypothetical protein
MIISKKISKRKQWFKDRIGKTVYRNKNTCDCKTCKRVYKNGLVITDDMHADYLFCCESEFTFEGHPLKYFDTIKERNEFEKSLPDIQKNTSGKKKK